MDRLEGSSECVQHFNGWIRLHAASIIGRCPLVEISQTESGPTPSLLRSLRTPFANTPSTSNPPRNSYLSTIHCDGSEVPCGERSYRYTETGGPLDRGAARSGFNQFRRYRHGGQAKNQSFWRPCGLDEHNVFS